MNALKQLASFLPPLARDHITRIWRKIRGNPDFHVLRILADPSKLAVDVGANAGYYAHELARHSKGCIAFEPVPELASAIKNKFQAFGVTVHACALSDRTGHVTLRIPIAKDGENPANASVEPNDRSIGIRTRNIEVECRRLDDFEFDPVGVIKMDAEGHEEAILRGATTLIERDKPSILIEADDNRHKPGCVAAARDYFLHRGYEGFFLLGRQLVPLPQFDFIEHQNPENLDTNGRTIFNRTYVDTFVFAFDRKIIEKLAQIAGAGVSL